MASATEKAKELVEKFSAEIPDYIYQGKKLIGAAKSCALVCVDEILKVTAPFIDRYEAYYHDLKEDKTQEYWQSVREEIKKL